MSKDNSNFFKEKKDWSKVKDTLLGCYLTPYFAKIFHTRRPTLYVDCFAGKGIFEDGNPGSPMIALDVLNKSIENANISNIAIECIFIESEHFEELKKNLVDLPTNQILGIKVVSGKYEEKIKEILQNKNRYNVFLYLDPFGVKPLDFSIFSDLSDSRFNSLELLINLNTFGFIRAACSAMNTEFDIKEFEDVLGPETEMDGKPETLMATLTQIAGGDYWKDIIIQNRRNGKIDAYRAESQFSAKYCEKLKQHFKFVINMPLRLKPGQQPKYRLIHATNHEDGCVLMNDNMCHRWEVLKKTQRGKQQTLFQEDVENEIIDPETITDEMLKMINKDFKDYTNLNVVLATYISLSGVQCSTADMNTFLRNLEDGKKIDIRRSPSVTKSGKPAAFMTTSKGQTVEVKCSKRD